MKLTIFLMIFLAVSCGNDPSPQSSGIGELETGTPYTITTGENIIFDSICAGLTKKAQNIGASSSTVYTFDLSGTDCDNKVVLTETQQVSVDNSQFRRVDNSALFIFPSIETPTNGFMSPLCSGASSSFPIIKANGDAVWISTNAFGTSDCPSVSNEQCVMVKTGSKEGTGYRIHTKEFVRFHMRSTDGIYGHFTYRKILKQNNCDYGDFTQTSATLR